jgi:intein/homing endonuclease
MPKEKPINSELNEDFAEFIGILIGDGHVGERHNTCNFKITGNPKTEQSYYKHISKLSSQIALRDVNSRIMDTGRSIGVTFCSKQLGKVLFNMGFPRTNKCHTVTIPYRILKNKRLSIACLRGIFDTDGCLTIKKRYRIKPYYPTITFVSASKDLILQISILLDKFNIKHCTILSRSYFDNRTKKYYTKSFIHIYGFERVKKWFDIIGTSNIQTRLKFEQNMKKK